MNLRRAWARRELIAIGALVVVASGLAMSDTVADEPARTSSIERTDSPTSDAAPPVTERQSSPTTAVTAAPAREPEGPSEGPDQSGFTVRSVVDGDTVSLDDGRTIRLAQVDAPETNQCFGSESTAALRRLVDGKQVTLRRPEGAPATDRYGRTLGELLVDGVSTHEQLIRDGAAEWYEQFAHEDTDLARRLQAAEAEARAAGRGLWSACSSGATPPSTTPATTTTSPPIQPLAGQPRSGCEPAYPDDCIPPAPPDLDCGSATVRRRIRVDHTHGDPHRFDANKDGWGCESFG